MIKHPGRLLMMEFCLESNSQYKVHVTSFGGHCGQLAVEILTVLEGVKIIPLCFMVSHSVVSFKYLAICLSGFKCSFVVVH